MTPRTQGATRERFACTIPGMARSHPCPPLHVLLAATVAITSLAAQDDPVLARALREWRAIRDADAVVLARVGAVHESPGIWCGVLVTRQDVTWRIERLVAGTCDASELRIGHLLVAGSALVSADAPFLDPARIAVGARALLCLRTDGGAPAVLDEDYGVRLLDAPRALDPDRVAMLRALFRLDALRPSLHLETRAPVVELGEQLPVGTALEIGERRVRFLPPELVGETPCIRIRSCSVVGDRAALEFTLDAEGIRGRLGFERRPDGLALVDQELAPR
jgi:hypothetical protein